MVWSVADLQALPALEIGPSEVLYGYVSLDGEPSSEAEELLDEQEARRADRFVRPSDRRRFVFAHAALRLILRSCLGVAAARVSYRLGPHGKPELTETALPLTFNLSHSGDLALIAIARSVAVGVDLEQVRDLESIAGIVERQFSADEQAELRALPSGERLHAFFRGWTRKEAVVKMIGEGLGHALDRFEVELAPGSLSALRHLDGRPGATAEASLRDLLPPAGYAAAGAVAAPARAGISWREL